MNDSTQLPALGTTLLKGAVRRCPSCGEGHAFNGYLKVVDACGACGTKLGHYKSDDFPPYLTILIVGHLAVALMVHFTNFHEPLPVWAPFFWPSLTLFLALLILPFIKGVVLAIFWHLDTKGVLHEDSLRK